MSEQSDRNGNPSYAHKRIDDDDDFSFLNHLVLDDSDGVTNEEIIEALGDDDTAVKVRPQGAAAAPEPTSPSIEPGMLNPPPPDDQHESPADDDLDDFSSIIGEEPEREQKTHHLPAALDHDSAELGCAQDLQHRPEPKHEASAPAPAGPVGALTDDDIEAIEALEDGANRPSPPNYVAPPPPSKFDGYPAVTDPEKLSKLRELSRRLKAWPERQRASGRRWEKLLDEARARYRAPEREAKKIAREERDRDRKQNDRDAKTASKRIQALDKACASPKGDNFLVKLRSQSAELEGVRQAMVAARTWHGPKASLNKIATTYRHLFGKPMSKDVVRNRVRTVKKLEAPGGLWHRWIAS